MHEIKSGIDLGERHCVGDHFIDMDFALHVPVHDGDFFYAFFVATVCFGYLIFFLVLSLRSLSTSCAV